MPNLEEHCARTLRRYGVEGRDIHSWMDEPCKTYVGAHRQFRHNTETIYLEGRLFHTIYGSELAENIALDHITADHKEEVKNRHTNSPPLAIQSVPTETPRSDSNGYPEGYRHPILVKCSVCKKQVPRDFPTSSFVQTRKIKEN